jgi:hypothetical protein
LRPRMGFEPQFVLEPEIAENELARDAERHLRNTHSRAILI